ncbi:hypothetical protein Emed_001831 [Eimeria media]
MVSLCFTKKALWGAAVSFLLSTADAKVGVKVPTIQVQPLRFGPKPVNEEFSVEVPVSSDAKTIRTSVDAVLEGIDQFRPGEKQLRRASSYDELELVRTNSPEANLETLKASLGSQWLSDAVNARFYRAAAAAAALATAKAATAVRTLAAAGILRLMQAKALAEDCPAAQQALSPLSCSAQEIDQIKEAAIAVETAVLESTGDTQLACSKVLTELLHYLDLSVFATPFVLYQQGATPFHALDEAFAHWGLSTRGNGRASSSASPADDVPPSHVELRSMRITSSFQGPSLQPVGEQQLKEPVNINDVLPRGLTATLLRTIPRAQIFFAAGYNPVLKAGLMLLLIAHLQYKELFSKTFASPTTRIFPDLVTFLSSSIASQRRQADSLCNVKLKKIRDVPKLPKGYHFIPRLFMIRKVFATGHPKLACDLLDDAINNTKANYEHALAYFNEVMNHLPVERKRRTILLQKNTPPAINLKRLCFSLSPRPEADVLDKPNPCSLSDLDLPRDQRDTPSFLQANRETIAKPEITAEALSPRDNDKLEFYFELINNMGTGGSSLGSILAKFAVQKSDFPLTRDPRTYDEIVAAAQKSEEVVRTLGWLARQEPCAGHHCADWKKLHPYNVMMTHPRFYDLLSAHSPWARMMLVFYEWYGLYDLGAKHIQTTDAVYKLNGFQASYMVEGRLLMSQLSPEAIFALQSAFRPVVHHNTFHLLNQYAAFMSEPNGAQKHKGGVAKELEDLISTWTYAGMPSAVQEKTRQGQSPTTEDFKGFKLTAPPPDTNDLNHSIKSAMISAIERLSYQPELQEEFWVSCQNPSRASNSIQLLRDSHHLLTQAGDDLLLVGLVINPQQTTAGLHKNLLDRLLKAVNRAVDKLLRFPAYVLQHATYTVVVPDYARVALVVKELSQVYSRNPSVFKDVDIFRKTVSSMLDILQNEFFSPTGLPPSVPVTALLNNVDPYYNMMGATERAAEFRRSIMASFFSHIWKLVMNLSLDAMVSPKKVQKREKQYSQPAWQRAMMDPLQSNSMRMVIVGGDLGYTVFDKVLSRDQKRMLKNVRFGTGIMFAHNMLLAGKVHTELGYVSYGNFITAQSPFLGKVVVDWLEKRRNDRVREILGWISLALFFAGTIIEYVFLSTLFIPEHYQAFVVTSCD